MEEQYLPILPFDVIVNILVRLPAESLFRFRLVCKPWRTFITSAKFIRMHFELSASRGNHDILCCPKSFKPGSSFKFLSGNSPIKVFEKEFPFTFDSASSTVGCSSNGLVCLTAADDFNVTTYLFNPFIRKLKTIRSSSIDVMNKVFTFLVLGFGYHSRAKDFKIVRIAYIQKEPLFGDVFINDIIPDDLFDDINDNIPVDDLDVEGFDDNIDFDGFYDDNDGNDDNDNNNNADQIGETETEVEVYSLSSDSWKKIEVNSFPWHIYDKFSRAELNGCVHWMGHYLGINEKESVILSFNLGRETFQQIRLPNYHVDGAIDYGNNIAVHKGALSFVAFYPSQWNGSCSMWVMKEYGVVESWMKLFTIVDQRIHRPISITEDDEIIVNGENKDLVLYNLLDHECKHLEIDTEPQELEFLQLMNSLVLLESEGEMLELEDGGVRDGHRQQSR